MWPNLQFPADLVTFTEEICNGKFHFLCSADCCCAEYESREIVCMFWKSLKDNENSLGLMKLKLTRGSASLEGPLALGGEKESKYDKRTFFLGNKRTLFSAASL